MKRLLIFVLLFILLLPVVGFPQARQASTGSGLKTSDALIRTGSGYLSGILIITNGSNDASVVVYDNTSASGTKLFQGTVSAASNFGGATWEIPIRFQTGLYIDVTGTGASYITYYDF